MGNIEHGVPMPTHTGSDNNASFTCEDPRFHEDKLCSCRDCACLYPRRRVYQTVDRSTQIITDSILQKAGDCGEMLLSTKNSPAR